MIVLASCQDVAEETGQIEPVAVEPGYPSLHTVPPRPQLSYTVEQRRAIVDGLIADRANARYSSDVVRYRAGLSTLPPPAAPTLAAVPLEPEPEAPDAADAIPTSEVARDAPVVNPETEFLYEDDDLDSFMEEMVKDRIGPPSPGSVGPGGEPEASAAPLGTRVIRASAVRPIPQAAAYPGRSPVVTLAMPPKTASLPVPDPAGPTASNRLQRAESPALAGRAPGVVWGMPDMAPAPTGPTRTAAALPPPSSPVETRLAGRAPGVVWGMPDMAASQVEPMPAVSETPADGVRPASPPAPVPVETTLAGRAPGVVWGMPDMPSAPAGQTTGAPKEVAAGITTAGAAPLPTPAKPRTAPADIILAGAAAAAAPPGHEPRRAAPPPPAPVKPAPPAPVNSVLAGPGPEWDTASRTAMAERPVEPLANAGDRSIRAPATGAAGIEVAGGLVGIDAPPRDRSAAVLLSVPFDHRSAMLTPDAVARLRQLLAEVQAPEARIKIVGEAAAPALALDRALAVGLALVQGGVPADRLELSLAQGGSGDHARLFLATPAL